MSLLTSLYRRTRLIAGCLARDVPPLLPLLRTPGGWAEVINRFQRVDYSDNPRGVRCLSRETSSLHVCDVLPFMGRRLLQAALKDWPFYLAAEPRFSESPVYSFIIPHRGQARETLLQTVIRSIASLPGEVECIVVEQDRERRLGPLPGNTRYVFAPHPSGSADWNKCYAFNAGARAARGKILICHDGDLLVPQGYSSEIHRLLTERGKPVAFPQRFLFYLQQSTTQEIVRSCLTAPLATAIPEAVKQNWVGGTLAITRQAYFDLGGFDERFTGWTGEDTEFHDRCLTLDGWFHGYIPFIHLWHPHQAQRDDPAVRAAQDKFTNDMLGQDRHERIRAAVRALQSNGEPR